MSQRRPAAVIVIAIIHLVFGVLGILMAAGAFYGIARGGPERYVSRLVMTEQLSKMQKQANGYTNEEYYEYVYTNLPEFSTAEWARAITDTMLSVVLLVAGVGLLRMAPWGRWLSIGYALFNIGYCLYAIYWNFTVYFPVMDAFFAEVAQRATPQQLGGMEAGKLFMKAAYIGMGPVLLLIYPVIVLIIMLLPSVGRAFRGEPESLVPRVARYETRTEEGDSGQTE